MSAARTCIELRSIYKVFGPSPAQAMGLLREGASKEELLAATGCNLGLRNVSLSIPAGGIYCIMGLSGSGKSTLVRHLNRLIEPTAGEVLIHGRDILKLGTPDLRHLRRHQVSMVFQGFGLLPHKTVLENACLGLSARGEPTAAARDKARQWLGRVGLQGHDNHYPDELSGGMRQRVGLARALAMETDIVLMDEAFSALDPLIRHDMQTLLLDLQERLQKTIVFITHDLDEAVRIGNHIAILHHGELVQTGTPSDILQHPADDHVRRFVEKRSATVAGGG